MFAAFAAFAGVAYWYYQDTQKALRTYAENQGKLQNAVQLQEETNAALVRDLKNMQQAFTQLTTEFEEARKQVENVEKLFVQGTDGRDLSVGERAIEDPAYIQNVLNKGTTELFRCFEILTGAPVGDEDAQAKYITCVDAVNNGSE